MHVNEPIKVRTPEHARQLNDYYLWLAQTYRLKAYEKLPWIPLYNGHIAQQKYDELMARADYINQERLYYYVHYLRCNERRVEQVQVCAPSAHLCL